MQTALSDSCFNHRVSTIRSSFGPFVLVALSLLLFRTLLALFVHYFYSFEEYKCTLCCNYNLLQGVLLTIPAHFPYQDEKWGNKIAQPTRIFNSLKISWNSALKIKRLEREWVGNIQYDIPYQVEEHSWCSILKGPRTTEANGGIFTKRRRKTQKTGTEVKTLSLPSCQLVVIWPCIIRVSFQV